MNRPMRHTSRVSILCAALAMMASPAHAQLPFDATARLAPQLVSYRIAAPVDERITEFAVPLFVAVPLGRSLVLDVGTAYAQTEVVSGAFKSSIDGLTDTQLRLSYTTRNENIVLTGGLNLPTGRATAQASELLAASRIGSDFLDFPISNMGTGFGVTAGIAFAHSFRNWSVGLGGSARRTGSYEPFRLGDTTFRYQPGDEYRVRIGADRPVGAGQVMLGLSYSTFGADELGGSIYNTGDRYVGQFSYSRPTALGMMSLGVWNLYRSEGERAGGLRAPWDNIANLSLSLGLPMGAASLEPTLQLRSWWQGVEASGAAAARTDQSTLGELGLRVRLPVAGLFIVPGVSGTVGQVRDATGETASLTGYRGILTIQLR
jgi:hypothetical protein